MGKVDSRPRLHGGRLFALTHHRSSALAQSQVYPGIGEDMSSSVAESIKVGLRLNGTGMEIA